MTQRLSSEELREIAERWQGGVNGNYVENPTDVPRLLAHIAALDAENALFKNALTKIKSICGESDKRGDLAPYIIARNALLGKSTE